MVMAPLALELRLLCACNCIGVCVCGHVNTPWPSSPGEVAGPTGGPWGGSSGHGLSWPILFCVPVSFDRYILQACVYMYTYITGMVRSGPHSFALLQPHPLSSQIPPDAVCHMQCVCVWVSVATL